MLTFTRGYPAKNEILSWGKFLLQKCWVFVVRGQTDGYLQNGRRYNHNETAWKMDGMTSSPLLFFRGTIDSVANLNVEVFQHQMSTALSFWCCNKLDENHFPHIKATQKAMAPMGFWLEQIFGTRCKPLPILVAKHSSPAGFFILLLWDPKTMVNFPKNYQTRGSISISWEGQCFPLSSLQEESS